MGLVALPQPYATTRAGSITDKLVKEAKRKATPEHLEHARLGEEDLSNTLRSKYLGKVQSKDEDPSHYRALYHKHLVPLSRPKKVLNDTKLPKSLRLRLSGSLLV